MIKSFKAKETEKIFNQEYSLKLPSSIQRVALRKLWMIDAAQTINDLRIPPANHLEQLKGDRRGQYSIRINEQWRICFKWHQDNAFEVEITDYHN
ncbi:MAG: type II toxin-antitoxin system RelE/ParE family toxin [Candidatus Uhrbacteria bacterium]